jgi:N-acetylglucosaminyl-diphospho-decaprenol L-rhamnosyltransferase
VVIELSVVIVNWNVRDLLRSCLRSVYAGWGADLAGLEVWVVDNASTDGSAAMVHAEFPAAIVLENRDNVGFTVGNNQAIGRARGRCVLLLNPDTEVLGDALHAMVACLDAHPDIGALGPQLLNVDRTVQSSRRRFPTFRTALLESTVLQQWWPDNNVLRRYYVLDRDDAEFQDVDWVVGACLMARQEALARIGGLDEGYFMYSEEMDWCYRLKQAGWRVVYLPTARVVHYGGQSSRQVVAAQHIHFQRSKIRFFRKHRGAAYAALLRGFLLLNYGYQAAAEGLKWLVGHKRPLRAERLRAYGQVLRSGL